MQKYFINEPYYILYSKTAREQGPFNFAVINKIDKNAGGYTGLFPFDRNFSYSIFVHRRAGNRA